MAKISTYPTSQPTLNDILIGSDADNLDVTKNYLLKDIIALIPGGSLSVQSLNTLTGVVTINGLGGITVTETGSVISIDGSNAGSISSLTTNGTSGDADLTAGVLNIPNYGTGQFSSLTTLGNSGSSTLVAGVLNVPEYQRAITVTTGGSGAASLIGAQLNIPYESISLTTLGNSAAATLTGNVLNVPQYQRELTVTTGGSGRASIIGAQLNIPYLNSYNTGAPTVVSASSGGSSSIPTALSSGATVNMYSGTWSGGNGDYTLTLPSATTDSYRSIRVITDGTFINTTMRILLTPVFGQTINGASSVTLNKTYSGILVWSDGSNWRVIQEIS